MTGATSLTVVVSMETLTSSAYKTTARTTVNATVFSGSAAAAPTTGTATARLTSHHCHRFIAATSCVQLVYGLVS